MCSPGDIFVDNRRLMSDPKLSPTDTILATHTASGMASRLGTESRPSLALNQRHVHWNQNARICSLHTNLTLI